MSSESVDKELADILAEGYREEMMSLLKYRQIASSLQRLYGSNDLAEIMRDEEMHANLFLEITKDLNLDVAFIGEEALRKELTAIANEELNIVKKYEYLIKSGKIKNERIVNLLKHLIEDSKRHSELLKQLSKKDFKKPAVFKH